MATVVTGAAEGAAFAGADAGVLVFGRVSEEEKVERMAAAHVHIATSVREGWGLVVSEAAAVGTPTISYDVPGLRDSTRAAGGVVVPGTPMAMAAVSSSRTAVQARPILESSSLRVTKMMTMITARASR